MKKRLVKTITVLCLLCGFFVPVRVLAEDVKNYYSIPHYSNNGYAVCEKIQNGTYAQIWVRNQSDNDLRFVDISYNGQLYWYVVSTTQYNNNFVYVRSDNSQSVGSYSLSSSIVVDGVTYRYFYQYTDGDSLNYRNAYHEYDASLGNVTSNAIYWTYGAGAVTPSGPDYGDLIDVRFNTDIAGSGTAAVNNIDHIKWNPENDSNGITFDGTERVQIKAIAGNYTSNSRNGILGLGATDFDYNSGEEHMLAEYPVTRGYYDVSWSHVITQLNAGSISDFLNIRLKGDDIWLKSGWIYQIRLVAGEYTSEWQTIYNATSSGVQNSLTVENSTEISMELVNVIQSINTMNSSQNENWTINNITINMENSDGQQTTDKPWWAYLLEAIVKAFGDILAFLGNLIGDLMDAITDLFKPAEFTINEYNDFKVEIKQNSGLFGQAIDFTNDLKNTFMGVQYQEPILHWQGITLDGVVFLPAADYNLNDYVEMWGLGNFRQIAYICSDGFIFFSLLLLIIRKLNEVLKK